MTPTSQNFFEEINLPADGEIVVYTDRSEFDTYCYLLNQLGNIITSSDDGGNGDNCSITASLRAGTYSILIRAYDSTSTGNFYLGSSCIGPYQKLTDPTADPDNSGGGGVDPGGLGDLSFVLIWTYTGSSRSEGPDIDLWVENPDGERLSTSRDGLALGPDSYGGTIDLDDRGGWGAGIGSGPERLSWPVASAPAGSYSFGTRYFEGDGDVEVTLKVYRGSTVTSTWIDTMTAAGQTKNLGTIAYP